MNQSFWTGPEGDAYVQRNLKSRIGSPRSNTALFSRILAKTHGVKTIVEYGAGAGHNLRAIHQLMPFVELSAFEINSQAIAAMPECVTTIVQHSITEPFTIQPQDMAFTKGLLIHIPPAKLPAAYQTLYAASRQYIMIAEYHNPTPVEVEYRGQMGILWKRDFAGEMLGTYGDLKLIDYGFVSRHDAFPQDDITWFLMEKRTCP